MGRFIPVVTGGSDRKVSMHVPMVIPAGAEYDIMVHNQEDQPSIEIRDHEGTVLVEVTTAGQVIVLDGNERRQLN